MIRVVLIEDHGLVRTGYRMILQEAVDMEVVGEAEDGEAGLQLIRQQKPDVVVCDLHLPGLSGLDVTERVIKAQYGCNVVIVSMQTDGPMPRRLLDAGAKGYISKACPGEELLNAIRDVSRGKRYLGADIARNLAMAAVNGDSSPFDQLMPREVAVARLLVRGSRGKDIAEQLSLSAKTVSTHKTRLYEKLEINDLASLTRLASRYGLLEPES